MIVIFGSINVDLIVPVPRLPRPGETVLGSDYALLPGGKGANQALAARRAGAEVVLAGAVGADSFAATALDLLRRDGVDTQLVRVVEQPTGCAAIMVSSEGENTIAVASAAGGAAPDFAVLVSARAVQGLFAALLAPSALTLLATTFTDAKERGRAFAVYGAVAGGGGSVGLLLGGVLTSYASWRWCLYVNLIFAAVAAGLFAYRTGAGPFGTITIGLIAGAATLVIGQFIFATIRSPPRTWISSD